MMSSRLLLFAAAATGTVIALNLILKPRVFRYVMYGFITGSSFVLCASYLNQYRSHSISAHHINIGIRNLPPNFSCIQPVIYKDISEEYENRGELELGEEYITVEPHVFSQIGIIDVDGVRKMWTKHIVPHFKEIAKSKLPFDDSTQPVDMLEKEIVFCDLGSGVGNVCLQILAETKCEKCIGVEVISSRVRVAQTATQRAIKYYHEIFDNKQIIWKNENVVNAAELLRSEEVNVIFTHSWMFDDDLMKKLSNILITIPSLECIITSRHLTPEVVKNSEFSLSAVTTYSADWNSEAPFYVYYRNAAHESSQTLEIYWKNVLRNAEFNLDNSLRRKQMSQFNFLYNNFT